MTRAAVCGTIFDDAIDALGLVPSEQRADVALVDLGDDAAIDRAGSIPPHVPRVLVGRPEHERLLRAAGVTLAIAPAADPAILGPLVRTALPSRSRAATRLVVVTGTGGGVGRTMLVASLAHRLARHAAVLVIDATGSGAAGWWLGLTPGPWSDLEALVDELTGEHLSIVAAERERVRVIGGGSAMPSDVVLSATVRAAAAISDVVLIDAPSLFDQRTRALIDVADRVIVVATADPAAAGLDGVPDDDRVWIVASRSHTDALGGRPVLRSLPDDPGSVRSAARGPSPIGGALGRAYDDLAELLAIDIS